MKSRVNDYNYIEIIHNIYGQRIPASDEDAALIESKGLDINALYEVVPGVCAEIDYEYGDLNEDGYIYYELADGTNWLYDNATTSRVPRKINHPERLHWGDEGLTHCNGRPVQEIAMDDADIREFHGWEE